MFLFTTYSKVKDVAQIYEIKIKIHSTNKGTFYVIEYYNIMKGIKDHGLNLIITKMLWSIVKMLLCN